MRVMVFAFVLALCACVPGAEEERASRQSARAASSSAYVVRGQPRARWTPGWSLVFLDDRILLDSPTSAGWYSFREAGRQQAGRVRSYEVEGLKVAIEGEACGLPDFPASLPDRVRLEWDGGRFEGCGGARTPPEDMAGTVWELTRIGREPAPSSRSPAATLLFGADGALGGTLVCNDGGVETTWDSGGFVTRGGGFTQTAMGCNQPAAEVFGTRFWNGMIDARAWRREDERLLVTLGDGSEAELRLLL